MASQRILISDGQGGKEESNGQQDVEVQVMKQPVGENSGLQRQLKSRHLQMIAIGTILSHYLFRWKLHYKLSLGTVRFLF